MIDDVNYTFFDQEINGEFICVEAKFISVPSILIKEISDVLAKYQIKIGSLFEKNYIQNFFEEQSLELSISAHKIKFGQNQNEISLVSKSYKKKGFFEKFFQLFS